MLIDEVTLEVSAGKGGDGVVRFTRTMMNEEGLRRQWRAAKRRALGRVRFGRASAVSVGQKRARGKRRKRRTKYAGRRRRR